MRAGEFVSQNLSSVSESIDPYRLERLDPQTRRALLRMADHAEPGSWLSASEAYAMQLGLQYKNRDPQGWEQGVQHLVDTYRQYSTVLEGWRDTLAGLALGAGVAMGSPAQAADTETVLVQPGQTVYSIARAFGTTPQVIQRLNRLGPDFRVEVDQEILVPKPGVTSDPVQTKPAAKTPVANKKPAAAAPGAAAKPTKNIDVNRTLTGTRGEALVTQTAIKAGIRKRSELAALLAQTAHESHDFRVMGEDLSYSAQGLMKTFPSAFPTARIASQYANRPQAIANRAYANRNGNGDEASGDGWRYRGRGYIQLTGRENYRRAGQALGLPLEKQPDIASQPEIAAQIAVWYWKNRTKPNVRNFYDTRRVTATINPAQAGARDRQENFSDFYQYLGKRDMRT